MAGGGGEIVCLKVTSDGWYGVILVVLCAGMYGKVVKECR